MTRVRTTIGIVSLCALATGALGAANASAEGLTAVECTNAPGGEGTGKFETNHCETPEVAKGNFETVALTEPTNIVTTNAEGEDASLTGTIALAKVVVTCTQTVGTGKVVNTFDEKANEHRAHGTEIQVHYTECEARLASGNPETEACEVQDDVTSENKGTILTNKLTSTTGPEHAVTFTEPSGGSLVTFWILNEGATGKECKLPNITVSIAGELIGRADTEKHSHLTFNEGTEGGKLRVNGATATYHGTEVGYLDEGLDEEGNPIEGNTAGLTTF